MTDLVNHPLCTDAAAELRRLHAENERLAAEVASRNRRALAGDEAVSALANVHAYYEGLQAQRDALLEALKDATKTIEHLGYPLAAIERARAAIKAVEEPVAWMTPGQDLHLNNGEGFRFSDWTPLYPAPPQRKPLTEEEIDRICALLGFAAINPAEIVRAVERAHGIGEQP